MVTHTIKQRALWRLLWVAIGFYYFCVVAEVLIVIIRPADAVPTTIAVAVLHQIIVAVVLYPPIVVDAIHQITVVLVAYQTMTAVAPQLPMIAVIL